MSDTEGKGEGEQINDIKLNENEDPNAAAEKKDATNTIAAAEKKDADVVDPNASGATTSTTVVDTNAAAEKKDADVVDPNASGATTSTTVVDTNAAAEKKDATNTIAAADNLNAATAANPKASGATTSTTVVDTNAAAEKKDATNTIAAATDVNTIADATAAAANTNADAAITTTTAAITPAGNTVYAIIQINADKITVLDNADGQTLNTTDSPYKLLVNKTPSVFAVKIVKKDKDKCKPTDKIICIDFDNSHYEMDLTTVVSDVPTLLLNQEFLTGSAEVVEDDAKVADEGAGKVAGKVDEGADNNNQILDSHHTRMYKTGDKVKYNNQNITIRGIGQNTEGQLSYFTDNGSRNGDDVDKTGELVNSGGSRKKRTQKSKKTKRKYYVYRK